MSNIQFESTTKYEGDKIVIVLKHIETGLYKGHTIFLEPDHSTLKYELDKIIDPAMTMMMDEMFKFIDSLSEAEYQRRLCNGRTGQVQELPSVCG